MARHLLYFGILFFLNSQLSTAEKKDNIHITEILDEILESEKPPLISPDTILLTFSPLPGQKLALNLTRNRNIKANLPVYLKKINGITQWDKEQGLQYNAFYVDVHQRASLHMEATPQGGRLLRTYKGMFRFGGKEYQIDPIESGRRKRSSRREYSVSPIEHDIEDLLMTDNIRDIPMREVKAPFEREALGYYQAQENMDDTGKHHYYIETLFVIDYGTYDRMWRMGTSRDLRDREDETISNLKYFFSHVANGIDLRYRTIDNEKYSINMRLIGLYIATSRLDAPWTEFNKEIEDGWSNSFVNAYTALDEFEAWLNSTKPLLPKYDHAALITSYQLFGSKRSDGSHRRISGLSDIKGICTNYWPASINQDRGIYSTTQTIAHEIGHSLGAYHDGSQNTCTGKDQFIMASSPGVVTDENYLNLFTFSHCSISEITKHLTFLNMMGRNCLVNSVPNHYDSALITHHLQTPPGQIFTIDQQCQYIHQSVSSYYCGGANNDRDICRVMECYHPDYKRCYSSVEQRAANGTSCGHKKWCMMGDCLDDQRAPAFLDYCWSGDYKGTFYDGRTCNKVVQDSPWMCYDEKYRDACCKRCEDIVDKNNQDCPYGDKNEWCEDISRRDCYTKQVKDVCCRSCARFLTGIEGCDYGDRAGWCSTVTPGSCYANEHTCCAKCASFAIQSRNDASCLYGDKAGWCSTVTAEQCYSVHSTCCNSCKRFKTQIPGCEFGNFGTHCGSRDCNDPYWANRCCATCSAYIQPPTTRVPKTSTEPTSQKPSTTARVSTTLRYNQTRTPSTTSSTTTSVPYIPPANIQCSMDKADWCQALPKNRCYLDNDVCCNTCPKHYTGIEGCEFGDHASWCDFIFPGSCYDPTYMKQCCKTCPTLIDLTAAIDCMYGDRYTWCEEILPSDCEDPKKRYECCKKCNSATTTTTTTTLSPSTDSPTPSTSRVTTSQQTTSTTRKHITSRTTTSAVVPTGILYPDCNFNSDASWCSSIPSSYCYSVEKSCCQKCSTFWKNNPGCEYGDHFTWCRRIDPTQCNDIYYKSECCSTCNQYIDSTTTVTLPPGCKYGDHYPSCESLTRRECYFKSYRDSCCSTCAMLKSNDPTCPWGDRYTDCSGADCTKLQVREYCCETCGVIPDVKEETTSSLSPISPECKDNATWCPNIPARDCYVSDHTCCRTCVEFYTGLPNCIYGDETSWCANVVFTVEDCANIRIGPYCCMTCFMITLRSGYELPPEPDIETNEGVLLILGDTSIDETLSKEPGLLDMLSLYLDEFCMASVKKCCEMAKLKKRQPLPPYGERRFRYFQKTHGHIGQGYPRNAYSGNIITKILMKFPTEFMDTMCYDPTKLWKRDVSRPSQIRFVEKYLLYSILIENELVIEQALDMKIVRVLSVDEANALSHTSTSSRDKVALAVGITALFGILFLVIILIVVVCSKKKKSRESKGNTKNVKSSADQHQPNAYTWVHEKHIHERKLRVVGDNESVSFDNIENSFQQDTMLKKKRNDTILDEGFENIAYTSMHRPDLLT